MGQKVKQGVLGFQREAGYVLALRLYIREFEGKVIQQDQQLGDIKCLRL